MVKKNSNSTQTNTASVKDGHLILSLPEADSPILWRKDLKEIGSATFQIKKEKDLFSLILKKQKGTTEKISSFDNKELAVTALNIASQALLDGETASPAATSKKRTANETAAAPKKKGFPKWLIILLILIGIIALYIYSLSQMPNRIVMNDAATPQSNTSNVAPAQNTTGVPMSADDFLNGR